MGDVGEDENLDKLMDLIVNTHNQLDVLVNNAGRGSDRKEKSIIKNFDNLHKVNLRSVYYLCLK